MHATDTALVTSALRGEQAGIAGMYDRYADRLHNYAWSVCRSHADASDIVQDTFITASQRLGQLRDPERLRPWLYAIARHQALRVIRERERVDVSSEIDMTIDFPEPASGLDAQQLVWDAAAGLDAKDRDILTLHLREGLDGEDLAAALGIKPNAANVALFRVRERLEHAVGAILLSRFARGECADLDTMMAGQLTPLIRKRANRHIEQCDTCRASRRRVGSPAALFAATPAALAPAALRDSVLASWGTAPTPSTEIPTWRDDGFPDGADLSPAIGPAAGPAVVPAVVRPASDISVRRARFAAAGGIAVVAIGVAFFALLRPATDEVTTSPALLEATTADATTVAPPIGSAAAPAPVTTETPPPAVAELGDEPTPTTAPPPASPPATPTTAVPTTEAPDSTEPGTTEPDSPSPFPPVADAPVDQPEIALGDSVNVTVLDFECDAMITVRLSVTSSSDPTVVVRYEKNGVVTDVELNESETEPNIYDDVLEVREGEHRITARATAGSAGDVELLSESCGQIG